MTEEISPENLKKGMAWNKPKTELMLQFEKETEYYAIWHGKITGHFEYWLFKNKLKKFNFSEVDQIISIASTKTWHKPGFREKMKKAQNTPEAKEKHKIATIKQWQDPKFRKRMSGKNHPMYGRDRSGEKGPAWKYDKVGYLAIHIRAHKIDPKPKDGICAYCHKVSDKKGITKLIHSNKDHSYNLPIVPDEWQWIHHSCHDKYDIENNLRYKNRLKEEII